MAALPLAIATALVALRCQLISDDPYVLGSVSRVLPATRPAFLRALNETRRLIGCPPESDPQEPAPPFEGGQCPDVQYTFRVSYVDANDTPNTAQNQFVLGPVGGLSFDPPNQSGGVSVFVLGGGSPAQRTFLLSTTQQNIGTIQITDVFPTFEQPDNCGSLPGTYPPPTNFNTDIDITYEIDDGTEVTVTIPFIFAPIKVDFNGTLRIPVNFSLGGFEFSGDINLPDFDFTINPPKLGQGDGEDLTGEGEDEPGESIPEAPPDEKIIGVVVNATQIDSRRVSSYSSPGITPIFVPRLGSIKFAYSIGIATFFSSDIDIKDRRTFIPCPFSQGADAVIASPNIGVDLTFTPIRGFPLATTKDIQNQS